MRISLVTTATLAAALMGSTVLAQEGDPDRLVWGGGPSGTSSYTDNYVPAVINGLTQNRLTGYAWAGPSAGTLQNAAEVTKHPTNLALAQWDLVQDLNGQPLPDGSGNYRFTVLAQSLGPECLYMVTDQVGYSTLGDVLGNAFDIELATGADGSGSLATFQRLQSLFPDLNDVTVDKVGSALDIVKKVKEDSKVTHGFFVMRPDPTSETFKYIADNDLTIVPVVDYNLEDKYSYANLKVSYGKYFWNGDSYISTACTSVSLITGDPAAVPEDQSKAKKRLQAVIERISAPGVADTLRPNTSTWRDMLDNIKIVTADAVKDILEASKVALENAQKRKGPAVTN